MIRYLLLALNVTALLLVIGSQLAAGDRQLPFRIGACTCDNGCFTDEVRDLSCSPSGISFKSDGLPDPSHVLMRGITATNQQYPRKHAYEIHIPSDPRPARTPVKTEPGPLGVAINGIPMFDPGTQGPIDHGTGRTSHTLDEGELDECGGHAGRGDDYHYHIAPKCLIDDLGRNHVEVKRQPIGFANDGYPILALGWFDPANGIERQLDRCRGATDAAGNYFYNIKTSRKWDILDCYAGEIRRMSRDRWQARRDRNGQEIVGAKASFHIRDYRTEGSGDALCHVMEGRLVNQRVIGGNGRIGTISGRDGAIFYCNPGCYAEFFEPEPKRDYHGPVLFYELETSACPASFNPGHLALFEPYTGPALQKRQPPPGNGPGPKQGDNPPPRRGDDGNPPPRPN